MGAFELSGKQNKNHHKSGGSNFVVGAISPSIHNNKNQKNLVPAIFVIFLIVYSCIRHARLGLSPQKLRFCPTLCVGGALAYPCAIKN